MGLLGEWLFNEHLNGIQLSRDWPLGTAYGTLDTRYDDICLPPLLTAVDLSGSDAAGGGSAGTAAAVSSAAFSGGMHATEKLIVGRGTKLGAIRLDTRASVFDGTAEGAGAPYAENVTDLLYTKSAGGTHEVSVCYDNTAYRVITAVPNTGGYTASENNQAHKYRHMGIAGSDAAASVVAGLGRGSGTPQNVVASNTLSGSTTMDGSAWQTRATVGEEVVFTGFALDGRFWCPHTNGGYYYLDSDGYRFRPQQEELAVDPNNRQGFGAQSFSYLGPAVLSPTIRGLRLIQGGASRSVGVDLFPGNNTPVNGRYGHAGGSEKWIYVPIYNTVTGNSYICAMRPRQPGDQHAQPFSWYALYELSTLESMICVYSGFKGGVTNPTVWIGRGSDVGWFTEPLTQRPWDDSGMTFAASGSLLGTLRVAAPGKVLLPEYVTLETAGCTASNTVTVDLVLTDARGVEQTVRCGGPIVSNGMKRVEVPPMPNGVVSFAVKLTMAGAGGNATPRVRRKSVCVWGGVQDA